jgi:hypothetical protein
MFCSVKAAYQVSVEVVQIGIDDNGNPRPFFAVPKDPAVADDGDNLAGVRVDDIAKEHVFSRCLSMRVYNSEFGALFRLPADASRRMMSLKSTRGSRALQAVIGSS